MKEQLTKFKTQFDLRANYNQKGLLDAKKTIYEPEISLSDRIDTSAQQNFTLKPLQIGFIQSLTLKDDPKFKEIQKIFTKYNAEVVSMPVNPASGLHLKKVVMDSMLKFLRMMMLAPDATTKKTILDISYYWFIKHLNPKSQRKPQTVMLKEIKKIVIQNNLLSREIVQKELPSEKLKQELQYYQVKARTEHRDLDAPQHQLQNYHIHKVGYITEKVVKVEDEEELRRKRLARLKFIKPNLEQYYLPPPQEQQKQAQKVQPPPQVPPLPGAQGQPVGPNQPPPAAQPVMNQEMRKQMQLLNQMGGQPQEPQQQAVEQDEDKKRGKLDPLVKVFLKKQFQQKSKQSQLPESSISNIQRYRNNYKQILHRQDEIFARCMNQWGSKKARVKTQAARRIQSIRMNHTQIVENTASRPFEQAFYQTKVNEVIREGRSYIKGELSRQKLNTQVSLSCFDRKRIKTVACSANKPFSQIIEDNKRVNMREEALDQIAYIKQKFAKQKIFASLQAMKKGLMHHEEEEKGDRTQKIQYPTNLMSNPFFVVKKKKKKGKKKK